MSDQDTVMLRFHMALSVDVDRFSDTVIRKNYLPIALFDGKPLAHPELLRRECRKAREKGLAVFPPCDNTDERGYCQGHLMEEEDKSDEHG